MKKEKTREITTAKFESGGKSFGFQVTQRTRSPVVENDTPSSLISPKTLFSTLEKKSKILDAYKQKVVYVLALSM